VHRGGETDAGRPPFRVPVEVGCSGLLDAEIRIPEYVNISVNITAPHPELTPGGVTVALGLVLRTGTRL
jgi:hypothetical protein